jgi:hypothetical protein
MSAGLEQVLLHVFAEAVSAVLTSSRPLRVGERRGREDKIAQPI